LANHKRRRRASVKPAELQKGRNCGEKDNRGGKKEGDDHHKRKPRKHEVGVFGESKTV